jgi:hypothetical protein
MALFLQTKPSVVGDGVATAASNTQNGIKSSTTIKTSKDAPLKGTINPKDKKQAPIDQRGQSQVTQTQSTDQQIQPSTIECQNLPRKYEGNRLIIDSGDCEM